MKIYLLFDYDDRCIMASCDSQKINNKRIEYNGLDENGDEDNSGPYYSYWMEIEDYKDPKFYKNKILNNLNKFINKWEEKIKKSININTILILDDLKKLIDFEKL